LSLQSEAATGSPRLSVAVCVLTYRRPDDLSELLPMLARQLMGATFSATVVVIDNDPAGSAVTVCGAAGDAVRYVHEPTPGIAAARNRALDEAAAADLLVFLDDDERPGPDWLELMVGTYLLDRPVGVVGPVVSEYDVEPDAWVRAGRFFDRLRRPTGSQVKVAATNNLLLDIAVLRRTGVRFDLRFGLSGGSDTLFTRSLTRAAGPLVWCDEAVVVDRVPAGRVTRSWVLRRAFRSGNSWSRTTVELADSGFDRLRRRAQLLGEAAVRLAGGAARWGVGAVTRSVSLRARGARTVARGAGMAVGVVGYTYAEYRRRPAAVAASA
jgi:GT2 family glycosyltransferase